MPQRPAFAPWLDDTNDVTATFLAAGQIPGLINLGGGLPDPCVWPVAEMAELASRAVTDHAAETLAYTPVTGIPDLRDLIAARFSEGDLHLTRDNVLIVAGGSQGLALTGNVLLEYGGRITSQSPAYLGALDTWRPQQPEYRHMRLERNDLDLPALMKDAQFAYTVPNFSNPTGRLVPTDIRHRLVEAAEQTGTWLIEDDPYGTLYYDGPPLPRLITLSAKGETPYNGPVIYMGTVSKELAPGLRIGWVIAAPNMIKALATAKQSADMCTSGLCQRMTHDAFATGLADRMLPGVIELYRTRRDALLAAMDTHLSDLFDWEKPSGGMFVWATARDASLDTNALMEVGLDHGVCISPSSVFDPEGRDHRSIRINFTLNPPDKLTEGIARLAKATRAMG
ncbi:PLP-dependent aminotransferase family protein [Roseovarius aestuariivivens]|uniref:aminotransferase-like domain-containing protein n=1 Tax=Roseovarius aestuariivivens TaxID=1888910 RepID=UPI0010816B98|nr:PLP-dependent aminotransferase family protein [Roseovarius aestuariivivens]